MDFLLSTEKRDWVKEGEHWCSFSLNRDRSTSLIFSTELWIGSSSHNALAQSGFYQKVIICPFGLWLDILFSLDLLKG